ncbi:Uncharacterised protein [Vibrio cholerae]|uniref:Uncharacterized protein n=1 Tax=Vibrio cholerae TaxID=666 RepID=A0A656AIC6_VIBCL|nr:Uncharacterised protein [Vibrio cholerae]CSB12277.1 Uncharacterised protein [Vibrio cholerae]CSB25295.1 Uncharacterised protein [Vibrio cholerae]CSC26840.1 Uncharacterised protein [Vibrio cholerae]CSC93845.1 Uncharacterised protein [Vibrio cholerae]
MPRSNRVQTFNLISNHAIPTAIQSRILEIDCSNRGIAIDSQVRHISHRLNMNVQSSSCSGIGGIGNFW